MTTPGTPEPVHETFASEAASPLGRVTRNRPPPGGPVFSGGPKNPEPIGATHAAAIVGGGLPRGKPCEGLHVRRYAPAGRRPRRVPHRSPRVLYGASWRAGKRAGFAAVCAVLTGVSLARPAKKRPTGYTGFKGAGRGVGTRHPLETVAAPTWPATTPPSATGHNHPGPVRAGRTARRGGRHGAT